MTKTDWRWSHLKRIEERQTRPEASARPARPSRVVTGALARESGERETTGYESLDPPRSLNSETGAIPIVIEAISSGYPALEPFKAIVSNLG